MLYLAKFQNYLAKLQNCIPFCGGLIYYSLW